MSAPRPACGTPKGYSAHRRRKEPACRPCTDAAAAYERGRQQARREAIARGEVIPGPGRPKAAATFITEVEHLAYSGAGWGRICQALNTSPAALDRRLYRHNRPDLSEAVFGPERYDITGRSTRAKAAA